MSFEPKPAINIAKDSDSELDAYIEAYELCKEYLNLDDTDRDDPITEVIDWIASERDATDAAVDRLEAISKRLAFDSDLDGIGELPSGAVFDELVTLLSPTDGEGESEEEEWPPDHPGEKE